MCWWAGVALVVMATRRALHFVFKVGNRFQTARFYRDVLGMKVQTRASGAGARGARAAEPHLAERRGAGVSPTRCPTLAPALPLALSRFQLQEVLLGLEGLGKGPHILSVADYGPTHVPSFKFIHKRVLRLRPLWSPPPGGKDRTKVPANSNSVSSDLEPFGLDHQHVQSSVSLWMVLLSNIQHLSAALSGYDSAGSLGDTGGSNWGAPDKQALERYKSAV